MENQMVEHEVEIAIEPDVMLPGTLTLPDGAYGIVVFAHSSMGSRHSPRNRFVARALNYGGLATLLFDLLTDEEELVDAHTAHLRADVPLLAGRVCGTIDWLVKQPETRPLNIGLFGASTGAAAALIAAAERPSFVSAVVSRGGRPDMANGALSRVRAATLLLVGEKDEPTIATNQAAFVYLTMEKRLELIPGASHLFEEPGTLEQVARLANDWFRRFLRDDA